MDAHHYYTKDRPTALRLLSTVNTSEVSTTKVLESRQRQYALARYDSHEFKELRYKTSQIFHSLLIILTFLDTYYRIFQF